LLAVEDHISHLQQANFIETRHYKQRFQGLSNDASSFDEADRPIGETMTRRKKKTTIITETDRVLILNRRSGAVEGWCEDCGDLAGMVRPEDAVAWAAFRLGPTYKTPGFKELPGIKTDAGEGGLEPWLRPA
jgi:hypothetical protein